jgi:hypothetical protein
VPKAVQGTAFASMLAARNQAIATDTLKRMTQRMLLNEIVALGNLGHKGKGHSPMIDIAQLFWSDQSDQDLLSSLSGGTTDLMAARSKT